MPDLECRLAKVEESLQERRRQADHDHEILEDIQRKINQMRGFMAGVAFVFSIAGFIVNLLWSRISGNA